MDILNSLSELLKTNNLTEALSAFSKGGNNEQLSSILPLISTFMGNKNGATCVTPENLSKELDILIRSTK